MTRYSRQAGFTLLELMLASTLSAILLIAALGILYDSVNIADVLQTRASLNAAARESFEILLDGGIEGADVISGLRGRNAVPAADQLREQGNKNRVRLKHAAVGNNSQLLSAAIAQKSITCAANDDPIRACNAPGALTVNGYLGGDPELISATRSVQNRTQELQITLFSAFLLSRGDATVAQSKEVYRTIVTLNLD